MRVLLLGGGGREHALAWKIAQSPEVEIVYCAPGNPGIFREKKCVCENISMDNQAGLIRFAGERKIDLVVVGPEEPLVNGIVDRFEAEGVLALGPSLAGARLEGSKAFAKQTMKKYKVPTADFEVFSDYHEAMAFIESNPKPWVIKADGLAAGKGVFPCRTLEQAKVVLHRLMVEQDFGNAGTSVVVESFLEGEEVSCIGLTDGEDLVLFSSTQDHKRALDGDQGLNTGGMGAYSPAPIWDAALEAQVRSSIFQPLLAGLKAENISYRGVLYVGIMVDDSGPKVLEFNVRFGDPETQPLMLRLKSDLAPLLYKTAKGELKGIEVEWDPRPAVCVVLVSQGYPQAYEIGFEIQGLQTLDMQDDLVVFHAGTAIRGKQTVTAGGRVLGMTARGEDLPQAVNRAYAGAAGICFEGMRFRKDIAYRALQRS